MCPGGQCSCPHAKFRKLFLKYFTWSRGFLLVNNNCLDYAVIYGNAPSFGASDIPIGTLTSEFAPRRVVEPIQLMTNWLKNIAKFKKKLKILMYKKFLRSVYRMFLRINNQSIL